MGRSIRFGMRNSPLRYCVVQWQCEFGTRELRSRSRSRFCGNGLVSKAVAVSGLALDDRIWTLDDVFVLVSYIIHLGLVVYRCQVSRYLLVVFYLVSCLYCCNGHGTSSRQASCFPVASWKEGYWWTLSRKGSWRLEYVHVFGIER
jgi:hypothetical protein